MKTLRLGLGVLLVNITVSNSYADGYNTEQFNFKNFIKSSFKLALDCKNVNGDKKLVIADQISDYINEVEYRCTSVNKSMPHEYSECKLTLYRLKSDYMECDRKDYYIDRVQKYLLKK